MSLKHELIHTQHTYFCSEVCVSMYNIVHLHFNLIVRKLPPYSHITVFQFLLSDYSHMKMLVRKVNLSGYI